MEYINKKIIYIFILLILKTSVYSFDKNDLNGYWVDKQTYNYLLQNPRLLGSDYVSWGYMKFIPNSGLLIEVNGVKKTQNNSYGRLIDLNESYILVYQKSFSNFEIELNKYFDKELYPLGTAIITFDDIDKIHWEGFSFGDDNFSNRYYYKISAPAKISIKNAVLNDSNVRLRVKPNLNCDTWTKLSKGTKVKVKDKSSEEYEIDGEKWYWYKVDIENLPDGWVYGKYLDIEE